MLTNGNIQEIPAELYHYTNLESLALILKNKTIRFSPLSTLDDPQEQETSDIPNFGHYFYASCWTDSNVESIPMWNMYASLESGVRIALPYFPFKRWGTERLNISRAHCITNQPNGELSVRELKPGIEIQSLGLISAFRVIYTDNAEQLKPPITDQATGRFFINKTSMGRYKNKYWEFQTEWRYLIDATDWCRYSTERPGLEFIERRRAMLNGDKTTAPNYIDLPLNATLFKEMTVTLSPKMSAGNQLLAEALFNKYGVTHIVPSELQGLL